MIGGSQTVQRAIQLVRLISRHPETGLRLIDITRYTQMERPTIHRLLQTLVAEGMLRQNAKRRYLPGPLLFELSLVSGHQFDLVSLYRPILEDLAKETGDTSFLFVRHGNYAVCRAVEQGSHYIQTPVVREGSRQPLGVSSGGLAILSALPETETAIVIDAVTARLPDYSNLSPDEVWQYYHTSRREGRAVIANRAAPGVKGVGVPVYNALGSPIAAITVATTIARMDAQHIEEVTPLLHTAADSMAKILRTRLCTEQEFLENDD